MTNKHIPATISMFSVGPWLIVKCLLVTSSLNSKFAIHLHEVYSFVACDFISSYKKFTVVLMYFFIERVLVLVIFPRLG
jgi:hypothetical protein